MVIRSFENSQNQIWVIEFFPHVLWEARTNVKLRPQLPTFHHEHLSTKRSLTVITELINFPWSLHWCIDDWNNERSNIWRLIMFGPMLMTWPWGSLSLARPILFCSIRLQKGHTCRKSLQFWARWNSGWPSPLSSSSPALKRFPTPDSSRGWRWTIALLFKPLTESAPHSENCLFIFNFWVEIHMW